MFCLEMNVLMKMRRHMKNNILKYILFSLFVLCVNNLYSQTFQAGLTKVDSSGFYMVNIPLEIMKEVDNLSDFMLINNQGEVVSYFVRDVDSIKFNYSYSSYKSDISLKRKSTEVIIETDKRPINHFYMQGSNSQVVKSAIVLGSNDSLNWFNVRDQFTLNPESKTRTEVLLKVEFPKSDYRLYKMIISDSLSAPLNITDIKYVIIDTVKVDNFIERVVENVNYNDSILNTVQLSMSLPKNIFIDNLNVYVSTPRFFNREVRVYNSKESIQVSTTRRNRRDKRRGKSSSMYRSGNLISNDIGVSKLYIADKCDSLYIDIINGSNTPLSIDSITFITIKHELIAYLERGEYCLVYGNIAKQSSYDMSFVNHIPQMIQELEVLSIKPYTQIEVSKDTGILKIFIEKYSILIIITIAIIVIFSISYQLIRDRKDEESKL